MMIKNQQTGLVWEVIDKKMQKRLLAQGHYEQVNTKKPVSTQKKE